MSVKAPREFITGEEYGRQRRKLLEEGKGFKSPEMQALVARVIERDDYLWQRYATSLKEKYPNQWAAISEDGEWIVRPTGSEAIAEGTERYGAGNFVYGRLAEFRGRVLRGC